MPKSKRARAALAHGSGPSPFNWTRQPPAGRGDRPRFTVVGAGNGGMAIAGHLGLMGFPVTLYNRTDEKLEDVRERGGIRLSGAVSGFGRIARATARIDEALSAADLVWVTTPASAHGEVARLMAPHLTSEQIVILNPGRTGGSLHVRSILATQHVEPPVVAETQTFLYASRAIGPSEAHIYREKNSVPLAALPAFEVGRVLSLVRHAFPQFVAARNVLHTGFANIGAVFHPAPLLLNAGRVESAHGFHYYHEGITPGIARMMERIDRERVAVAAAFGVDVMSAKEWLYAAYGAKGSNLHEAIQNNAAYAGIHAPTTLSHRYITEDVPTGLVPISSLGRLAGVATPCTDAVIELACTLSGTDYVARGRTADKLGLSKLTRRQTQVYLHTGELPERQATLPGWMAEPATSDATGRSVLDVPAPLDDPWPFPAGSH